MTNDRKCYYLNNFGSFGAVAKLRILFKLHGVDVELEELDEVVGDREGDDQHHQRRVLQWVLQM